MADINEIIPKSAIDGINQADKSITSLDESVKKFTTDIDALQKALKEGGISFDKLASAQNKAKENSTQLSEEQKKIEQIQTRLKGNTDKVVEARIRATQATKQQKDEISKIINEEKSEANSIDRLRQRNKELLKQRNAVNTGTKKGQAEIKKLNAELDKNNKRIKSNSDALSKQKQNVGNYSASIQNAAGQLGFMGGATSKVTAVMGVFSVSLKTLRGALISTGIGALVVALGSLASYFTATEEGAAKFQKIIIPFKILFGNLRDAASDLGERLVWVFDNPREAVSQLWEGIKQNLFVRLQASVKFISAFGDILQGVWELDTDKIKAGAEEAGKQFTDMLTGVENSAEKGASAVNNFIKGIAEETRKETAQATKLIDEQLTLDKRKRDFLLEEAELQRDINKNRVIANDQANYSAAERKKAIDQAIADNTRLGQERATIAAEELRILELQASFSDSNAETLNEIAAKQAEIVQIESQALASSKLMITRRNSVNNELEKELDLRQKILDKEAELFEFEDEESRSDAGDDPEILAAAKRSQDVIKFAQETTAALNAEEAIRLADLQSAYERELISKEEFEASKAEIEKEYNQTKLDNQLETVDAVAAAGNVLFDLQNAQLDIQAARLANQKQSELDAAQGNADKIAEINQKYAKKEADLRRKKAENEKKAAIFNAIINLAGAILTMLANTGGPAGFATAAIAAVFGGLQLATIIAQPIPKFYKGTDSAPGGVISVGEKGRELIDHNGQLLMATRPSLASGLEGAKIYNNAETERIMRGKDAGNFGYDSNDLMAVVDSNNRIEKAIQNKRELHFNASKSEIRERKGRYWKTYRNAKFN